MKDRITEFLVKKNISPAEFADKIGVQRSSVSHVLNGRNYPGASFIQKMLSSYKDLNPRWLLLGEGKMIDLQNSVKEPSLFSFPSSGENSENQDSHVKKLQVAQDNEELFSGVDQQIEAKSVKTTVTETKSESNEIIDGSMTGNKEIERIVLFYKDKTFSMYSPSK